MKTRIEELCNRHIAGTTVPRDLNERPITTAEILDCLLLTAALDREHAGQIKQAITTAPWYANRPRSTAFTCTRRTGCTTWRSTLMPAPCSPR